MKKTALICALASLFLVAACGNNAQTSSPTSNSDNKATEPVQVANEGHLNIYNWSDYVDPKTVQDFERESHIKVRYDYYDSNETLEAKVLTGRSGYDLVVPSISNVSRQIQAGAYQPIDKSQISNYSNIDPELLKLMDQVDPGNQYAVPYFWGINTIGINQDKVMAALDNKLPDNLWDLVFNPDYTSKLKACGISYFDSPSEQFPLALHYLHKDPNSNDVNDLQAAAALMKTVRGDIKRFSSSGYIDDLARGNLCVAIGYGGDLNIAKTRATEANNGVNIDVLVPKEGVAVWIDSFMIPKDAQNVANAHKYINYTLEPQVAAKNGDFVTYAPASLPAKALMDPKIAQNPSVFPSKETLKNSFVNLPKSPDTVKLSVRLWQELKAGQ